MFALSLYWDRDETGNFKWPVYVWLQKQKSEIYDITGIILLVEKYFDVDNVAAVIALVLCMGGNDFLPNFHNISHDKLLSVVVSDKAILKDLFKFQKAEGKLMCTINVNVYVDIIKRLYCPVNLEHSILTPDEVRQLSIKPPNKDFRHPQSWMPPVSALQTLAQLIQCQIDYLSRTNTGDLIYTMGPDMHTDDKITLLRLSDEDLAGVISRAKIVRKKYVRKPGTQSSKGILHRKSQPYSGPDDSIPSVIDKLKDLAQQGKFPLDNTGLSDDDDVTSLQFADMSLDDIETLYGPMTEEQLPDETTGRSLTSEQHLTKVSTPKDTKYVQAKSDEMGQSDEDIASISLADLSLDEIPCGSVAEKRPREETAGKQVIAKRVSRMSTPKDRKSRKALDY